MYFICMPKELVTYLPIDICVLSFIFIITLVWDFSPRHSSITLLLSFLELKLSDPVLVWYARVTYLITQKLISNWVNFLLIFEALEMGRVESKFKRQMTIASPSVLQFPINHFREILDISNPTPNLPPNPRPPPTLRHSSC